MPSDTDRQAWRDIADHGALAHDWAVEVDAEAFARDLMRFHATVRCLEIVSEAARRLSEPARSDDLPWRAIMDSGNAYRHAYHQITPLRIRYTAIINLPVLIAAAEAALAS
ncbi:hypothetical protein BZG35_04310 [Brevundimonas sp. LM2]|uniref:HepT-like ribonuclease domain-containing protein n=1 Tax=Brevundimonas sp. LM2 TaxID=1938605 RepID=UPI000983BC02|nr:HepT-like ribonuclease domain-containing protein [Brevundimonas sp. LM2]AQR60965.1 hypothetical protein BZG35_04310 [Brevundimonas sp. LM2]